MAEAVREVDELYENQRFYGLIWKAPLSVLDRPEWSDAQGNPVALARLPGEDLEAWEPAVGPATDAEGWQYATVFKHLEYKRPGGRAVRRFNDTVRRRLWRRRAGASHAASPAVSVPAAASGMQAAAAAAGAAADVGRSGAGSGAAASAAAAAMAAAEATRRVREAEARKQAIKGFISLIADLLTRRQIWTLVPWDPAALFLLYQKHQRVYQELQDQAYERRLFTADEEAPPSQLREGRTLLQDLICAAMHSRAAYGFPAAAGFMSTVPDFVKLQTLQPLTFDAVGGVSVEANNESVAALAGIAVEDILLAEWRNSPYRPCHYVAIDRANQCVVVSIRGSLQLGDLLSDLHAAPMEVDIAGADGWVHQGIFSAATYIHINTHPALQEAARRCPGWPVLLTGHSLGGGVAALLALLLQEAGLPEGLGPLRCITMGTAAVMSRPLAEACNELVTSVILGSDVVPHLSAASVEAVLVEASEESPVRRTVEGLGAKLAGALSAAKQQETLAAATAALSGTKIAGSWAAVKQASLRLSSSGSGLSRIASLVASPSGGSPTHQQQQQARQIPVIAQSMPPPEAAAPAQRQRQAAGQGTRQIPVLDLSSPAAQSQQAQQAQRQQPSEPSHPQGTDVLMPLADFDSPAVEAAIAQDAAAGRGPGAGGSSSAVPGPGNPELLYPPGRIIWVFPSDERMVEPGQAEEQLQAMDAAWQGAADDVMDEEEAGEGAVPRSLQQNAAPDAVQRGQQQQRQQQHLSSQAGGRSRGQRELTNEDAVVHGRGTVHLEEAMEAVETDADAGRASRPAGPAGSGVRRAPPVAVDADRASFERLLLMPDMLNDHLPDRIVAALQQL